MGCPAEVMWKRMLGRCMMEVHGEGCCETVFPADRKPRWKI